MAKGIKDIRGRLAMYKYEFDLLQKIPCTKEENKAYTQLLKEGAQLPENIEKYEYSNVDGYEFYQIYIPDLTEQEIHEYLTYKKLSILNTIKNCVLFFTVLTIIGIIVALFAFS